jgi:hypothetical protein
VGTLMLAIGHKPNNNEKSMISASVEGEIRTGAKISVNLFGKTNWGSTILSGASG